MGTLQTIKNALTPGDASTVREYRCNACGATFESAKDPERVKCMECLERDAEPVDE